MISIELKMETITCCRQGCGITFAVPSWWEMKRREDHTDFCCPNGHSQRFTGKNEADKLRDELQRERQKLDQAKADADYQRNRREQAERSAAAARGQVTKIKKRVGRGVCPCCNRYFAKLDRHMQTKHP